MPQVICHGIPDARPLKVGDKITIDCVAFHQGFHGDNARTVLVSDADGNGVSKELEQLARVTRESVEACIAESKPGLNYHVLAEIVHAIAEEHGYGVVREYGGHGIGRSLHMPPVICFHPHFMSSDNVMKVGDAFTIEPMLTLGSANIAHWGDNWTVVTSDGSPSCQYEHMVLLTESGTEVLTRTPSSEFMFSSDYARQQQ
eukprot:SAG31_NODE_7517_length_1666_cov_2.518188_2_plen_201_part_00